MIGLLLYYNIGEAMKQRMWLNKANKNTMRIYFKLIMLILGLGVVSTGWADTVCPNKVEGNTSCFTSEEYPGIDLSADRINDSTDSTVEQPKGFWSKLWGTAAP